MALSSLFGSLPELPNSPINVPINITSPSPQTVTFAVQSTSSNTNKGGHTIYPKHEQDDIAQIGKIYIIRKGVSYKKDKETPFHHWAIGIRFLDFWVVIEGVNGGELLVPGYSKSELTPNGTLIDMENATDGPLSEMADIPITSMLIITQFLKAFSVENLQYVEISPKQLHALAGSIPKKPYFPGTNDCQTWFLEAMSKLQHYEVGDKRLLHRVNDTIKSPIRIMALPAIKMAGMCTNLTYEMAKTTERICNLQEFPPSALVNGVGKITNHVINGASDTVSGAVGGVANLAVNAIGVATGGCATKSGIIADFKSLEHEVGAGRMGRGEATVKMFGKSVGSVVYGAANVTTNVVGGVAETASSLVSGVSDTFTDTVDLVGEIFEEVHPVGATVATPVIVVVGVAVGTAITVAKVGKGIGQTVLGIFRGLRSIF
ncbi:uncharacterized protein LOC132203297 isoform X2 [Neocloeon triangulifer]|nr:uncharacterized protein LOC132203297 isoform X2 [Neocloeon triangulifer]